MKNMFLALVLLVSATVFGATAYTPVYDSNGNFHAILVSGCNTLIMAGANNDPNMALFTAWLAAQNPPLTQATWLAANPWQPWGAMSLAAYQQQQVTALSTACNMLVAQQYPGLTLGALQTELALDISGVPNIPPATGYSRAPMPNRAAYLMPLYTWTQTIYGSGTTSIFYTIAAQIMACTTQSQVAAITWTTQLAAAQAADPKLTMAAAMAIQN